MIEDPRAVSVVPPAEPAGQATDGWAEGFARVYLTWDPARPEVREAALASFGADDAGFFAGGVGREQVVEWTAVVGSQVEGPRRRVVTVTAAAGGRLWHLAVPVRRDEFGRLGLAGEPAVVGPPPVAPAVEGGSGVEVADEALRLVVERAVGNYVAGERENLAADLAEGAAVSLPELTGRVRAVDEVVWSGRRRVSVLVEAAVGGAVLMLRYEVGLVRGDRWYVRSIGPDPRGLPQ